MPQSSVPASAAQRLLDDFMALSAQEWVSVVRLASSHRRLLVSSTGHLDTRSEKGLEACKEFLGALEAAAQTLGVEPEPRTYREHFTARYRGLFDGDTRSYRVDILEAGLSLTQHPVIWANGEAYEIDGGVIRHSEKLRVALAELGPILAITSCGSPKNSPRFDRSKLLWALRSLDSAWSRFESLYIGEMMKVQERARGLVSQAVACELRLSLLEQSLSSDQLLELPAYQAEKEALVACMARLNSVANFQRKGRDDLGVGILDAAAELLERCRKGDAVLPAAQAVAKQVVQSFEEFRDYLHMVQHHLDLLHPQLCRNTGLVSRLVRWEETWEVGARYVQNQEVLGALCHLVPKLQQARCKVPALAEMCEDCDAELFMVIPRIVLLCLLSDPEKPTELIRRLLPHRFEQAAGCALGGGAAAVRRLARSRSSPDLAADGRVAQASGLEMGPALRATTQKLWRTELLLTRAAPPGAPSAWDLLVRRAVGGTGGAGGLVASLEAGRSGEAAAMAAEELMHTLEGLSVELQRHSPAEWNECVGVLMQCLAGGEQAPAEHEQDFVL